MYRFKVAFLIDKNNNWIENYLSNFLKNLNTSKFRYTYFKDHKKIKNYDIVFILNYTKIIKKNYLIKNKLNLVIHSSKLPHGKGFAPLQWQVLENKKKICVSLIEAVNKVDSGNIYLQKNIQLDGTELYDELRFKQAKVIKYLIFKFLKQFPKNKSKKQFGKSTYFRRRKKEDSKVNINSTIKKIFPLMRISNNQNWPIYFNYKKKKYIIKIFKHDNKKNK
tara:strand:- start:273 stop:935 length:663 start_codon:yes stop_codon:yes gene_type:complete